VVLYNVVHYNVVHCNVVHYNVVHYNVVHCNVVHCNVVHYKSLTVGVKTVECNSETLWVNKECAGCTLKYVDWKLTLGNEMCDSGN